MDQPAMISLLPISSHAPTTSGNAPHICVTTMLMNSLHVDAKRTKTAEVSGSAQEKGFIT
jgi:hypothetical protein